MQPLTSKDLLAALKTFDYDFEVIECSEPTPTSELAAAQIGCQVAQIAKSICFIVNGNDPVLVVASGVNTVDDRKLATLMGVGRKKIKLAKAEQCIDIFGYAPGGVPPVGHRTADIRTYLDTGLQQFDRIYAAAGSNQINFGLTCKQLEAITTGSWVEIAKS